MHDGFFNSAMYRLRDRVRRAQGQACCVTACRTGFDLILHLPPMPQARGILLFTAGDAE